MSIAAILCFMGLVFRFPIAIFSVFYNLCTRFRRKSTAWKVSKYGVFSGPYFPVFGLNMDVLNLEENPLRKKFPNTEFFLVRISCIRTEYGDLLRKSPYLVRIQENTDQKNIRIWTFFLESFLSKELVLGKFLLLLLIGLTDLSFFLLKH